MNEKFITNLIEDFFETGVLECSIFQLNSIHDFIKNKVKELENRGDISPEYQMWQNFYSMVLIYLTETTATLNTSPNSLKVGFRDYLDKVYGLSVGELDDTSHSVLYEKYCAFVDANCCSKCLHFGIQPICMECPCGEVYDIN